MAMLLLIFLQHARYAAKLIVYCPFAKELECGAWIVLISNFISISQEMPIFMMPVIATLISQPF